MSCTQALGGECQERNTMAENTEERTAHARTNARLSKVRMKEQAAADAQYRLYSSPAASGNPRDEAGPLRVHQREV